LLVEDEDEVANLLLTILADIRADVAAIRKELVEDDGEEEE
jgi:hypothetical protein